jgi:tRNA(Leu) C34 or U34 (ribose-2'-O)-methylase TrmL
MQAAIRRVGFMTKIRKIEEKGLTFWRVWKVQSREEFDALRKQSTKKKVLSTRKGRKNKQRDSEPLGESYGQQEVAGTQEEVEVTAKEATDAEVQEQEDIFNEGEAQ